MEMDGQAVLNFSFITVSFLGGWLVSRIFTTLDTLANDMKLIPEKYVSKDDYREDIREVKELLGAIFKRLESKVDK